MIRPIRPVLHLSLMALLLPFVLYCPNEEETGNQTQFEENKTQVEKEPDNKTDEERQDPAHCSDKGENENKTEFKKNNTKFKDKKIYISRRAEKKECHDRNQEGEICKDESLSHREVNKKVGELYEEYYNRGRCENHSDCVTVYDRICQYDGGCPRPFYKNFKKKFTTKIMRLDELCRSRTERCNLRLQPELRLCMVTGDPRCIENKCRRNTKPYAMPTGVDTDGDGEPDATDTDDDNDTVLDVDDVDDDNDGLIEVHDLDTLDHIRHNLAGTSYKTGSTTADNQMGAPEAVTANCATDTDGFFLCGYELTGDLDFAQGASYASNTVNNDWRPNDPDPNDADNAGFNGIADFNAIFEGNDYSISHLYSRGESTNIGLFRSTTSTASIRNLGLLNTQLYGAVGDEHIGSLVGENQGSITNSYATGTVNGGDGNDRVGSLVGENQGSIINSYAASTANGGTGNDYVGGLVGLNGGSITNSYGTGNADGGTGNSNFVGGLVGYNIINGRITASYATGAANGGDGGDWVGGLVGWNGGGTITASFAMGATSGAGGLDFVGSLVGQNSGSITASYAAGDDARGGDGNDYVGGLVGWNAGGSITASYATSASDGAGGFDFVGSLAGLSSGSTHASYGFGSVANGEGTANRVGTPPDGVTHANDLTLANAGPEWNDANSNTLGAWDFGTNSQPPALRYADYDGAGNMYDCAHASCGSLLPGQRAGSVRRAVALNR